MASDARYGDRPFRGWGEARARGAGDRAAIAGGDARLEALLAAQRINLCWLQGRMDDAIAEHERAVSEYFPIAGWRYSLALSHAKAGHADDARRELERAARSEDAGLSHGALRILHPCFEAATVALLADPTRAGPLYDSLRPHSHLAVVGGHEGVTWYGSVSHYLGLLATTIGRPDDAAQHFRDAIAMHERAGARPWLALSAYAYAHVLLTRGAAEDRRRRHFTGRTRHSSLPRRSG